MKGGRVNVEAADSDERGLKRHKSERACQPWGRHARSDSVTVLTPATDGQKDSPTARMTRILKQIAPERKWARAQTYKTAKNARKRTYVQTPRPRPEAPARKYLMRVGPAL